MYLIHKLLNKNSRLLDIGCTLLLYAGGLGVDGGDGESRDITDCDVSSFVFGFDTEDVDEDEAAGAGVAVVVAAAALEALPALLAVPLERVTTLRFNGKSSSSESLRVKSTVSPEAAVVEVGSLLDITLAWLMLDLGGSVVMTSMSSEMTSTF